MILKRLLFYELIISCYSSSRELPLSWGGAVIDLDVDLCLLCFNRSLAFWQSLSESHGQSNLSL